MIDLVNECRISRTEHVAYLQFALACYVAILCERALILCSIEKYP